LSNKEVANSHSAKLEGSQDRRKDSNIGCAALRFLSDQLGYAVLVTSPDSRLLHANGHGTKLLSDESPFDVARGCVTVQGVMCSQWTARIPLAAQGTRYTVIKHQPPRIPEPITYRVAVTQAALKRSGDPIVFCVYNGHQQRHIDPVILRALYDLTPAEAATAAALFSGSSLAELARQRSTSIHTVRTQLKRVLQKCHVRSQLQLCLLLASGPGVF